MDEWVGWHGKSLSLPWRSTLCNHVARYGNSYKLAAKMPGVSNGIVSNVMKKYRVSKKEQGIEKI